MEKWKRRAKHDFQEISNIAVSWVSAGKECDLITDIGKVISNQQ